MLTACIQNTHTLVQLANKQKTKYLKNVENKQIKYEAKSAFLSLNTFEEKRKIISNMHQKGAK